MAEITQELLLDHFSYQNGHLYYRKNICRVAKKGQRFGGLRKDGYIGGKIKGKAYKEHRLIWLYHYGVWPKNKIDHRDQVKVNNRIENLREATASQNQFNKNYGRGTSKYKGVCWNKRLNKWVAAHKYDKKTTHLGVYDTEIEAAKAYDDAVRDLHGEYAVLNLEKDYG